MKHLISLSFKYIRRQKLRSVLTFLCIMLAVFIFNTFTAYLGSTIATLINFEKYYHKSQHVSLDGVLPYCEDIGEVQQLLENHVAVEDYYFSNVEGIWSLTERDDNGYLRYLDVQFDNGRSQKITFLNNEERSGTVSLAESQESIDRSYKDRPVVQEKNSVIFPYWVKELGYREGDTITITITPVRATLSEDSEQVKEVREWIKENSNGETRYEVTDDPEEEDQNTQVDYLADSPSYSTVDGKSLLAYILDNHSMNEVEFAEEIKGSPCTFTVKIAGFHAYNTSFYTMDEKNYLEMYSHPVNDIRLEELCNGENADFFAGCSTNELRNWKTAAVRISENIDFDNGVMMLLNDLGLEEKHQYDLVFNDTLLAYEMRSANAISAIMPLIAAVLILALVAWLICRFVIDNAFEISVQERSAQFATLRIMGASQAQLVALIFTEAIFYCITAVPIGVIAAFMACKTVMELIGGSLFSIFTFDVNPWITALGIIISLSGILISAYTSAMWAARKLSPMEALQYGKPRKTAKKERHRRSVLKRKSFGFVLDYTMKNISRTKSRYVISTIAMALGVVMFSFCMLGVSFVNSVVDKNSERLDVYDYQIELPSYKEKFAECAEELFKDSGYFSEFRINADTHFESGDYDTEFNAISQLYPDGQEADRWGFFFVKLVDRETYEANIEPLSGMTYDEFAASKSAIVYVNSGGSLNDRDRDEAGQVIRKQEDGYWSYLDKGFNEPPYAGVKGSAYQLPVIGAVCYDYNLGGHVGDAGLLIADASILPESLQGTIACSISLTVNGHRNHENAQAAIETFTSEVKSCMIRDYYMENTGLISFFNTIFRTLSIFLISVWLVGILTMVNSINTSVLNRQKELLMLRSVGMTKCQLQRSIMLEGVLYCALSTIMGLLIGVTGYYIFVSNIGWEETGLTTMQAITLPIILTIAGTIFLNLLIAVLATVPALDSLSKRMK